MREIILKQRYKLIKELGSGGFGKIYRAIDIHNNFPVVIKRLHPQKMVQKIVSRLAEKF